MLARCESEMQDSLMKYPSRVRRHTSSDSRCHQTLETASQFTQIHSILATSY